MAGYIGTHGMAHALETLIAAMSELQHRTDGQDVRLLLLGDGARKASLQAEVLRLGLTNVTFVDTVSKEQVARYWSLLDVAIIHLQRTELFKTVIPSKLFECMGMGIPVLHGVQGESADIVEREGAGLTFEPENTGELVEMLLRLRNSPALRQSMSERGLAGANHYDRNTLAVRMLDMLRRQKHRRIEL